MSQFKKRPELSSKAKRNSIIPSLKSLSAIREANKKKAGSTKLKASISRLKEISNLWEGLKQNVTSIKSLNNSPISMQKEKENNTIKSPTILVSTKGAAMKAIYRANIDLTIDKNEKKSYPQVNSGNDLQICDEECIHDLEMLNKAALQKDSAIKNYESLKQQFLCKYIYKHKECSQPINKM